MNFKRNKIYLLFLVFMVMIISVSAISAEEANDNTTISSTDSEVINQSNSVSTVSNDSQISLGQNDNTSNSLGISDTDSQNNYTGTVYFDSNVLDDLGDGSILSPYKTISGDRINGKIAIVQPGTYSIDDGFYISSPTKIIGLSADNTILHFSNDVITLNSYLRLENLTLTNVNIKNYYYFFAYNVLFTNCSNYWTIDMYNNRFGGVIYSKGDVGLYNCTFDSTNSEYGGAIYQLGGELYIVNSTFRNTSSSNFGGAIAINSTSLTIINSIFNRTVSTGDAGAAIYATESDVTIDQTSFTNCNSTFGTVCQLDGSIEISNSNFTNNSAKYYGGAIYDMYGPIDVNNCRFFYNYALNGGAISISDTSAKIRNSIFRNNNGTLLGGAIYALSSTDFISSNNSFYDNYALVNETIYNITELPMNYGNQNYTVIVRDNSTLFNGTLPSKYDLRDEGYVSSVKNQMSGGSCWAFAMLNSLESCILKAVGTLYDFSEENMKNLEAYYSDYAWNNMGYKLLPNTGGFDSMSIGYLVSWLGPVLEADDIYDDYSALSAYLNSSLTHIQDVYFIPARENYTDNDLVKKAIIDYGAVATSYYMNSNYLYGYSYYYPSSSSYSNHAVLIVGWDDNYSASNFGITPPGDGAWIVKNSWDTDWGDNGYFYVSYYDGTFLRVGEQTAYTFVLTDTAKYNKIYQYDVSGETDWFITSKNSIWYENIFTSSDEDTLAAFATYFDGATDYEAYILVNGNIVSSQNGTISQGGYHTINLDNPVKINKGDNFTIRLKITSKDGYANIPIQENSTVKSHLKSNVSFFSFDGVNWVDFSNYTSVNDPSALNHYYNGQVACLKAFTVGINSSKIILNSTVNYDSNNTTVISAHVLDENNQPIRNTYVDISINNVTYYRLTDDNGMVNLDLGVLSPGKYYIKVRFNGNLENAPSTANTSVYIKTVIVINANDLVTYYNDGNSLVINLTTLSGQPISDQEVNITINGEQYTLVTNDSGIAVLPIDELPGEYNVNISSENYSSVIKLTVLKNTINFVASDLVKQYGELSNLVIKLVDHDGNPIKNEEFYVNMSGNHYNLVTNDYGMVVLPINQTPGVYEAMIYYENNTKYSSNPLNVNITILKGNVTLIGSDLVKFYRNSSNLTVQVLDLEGNPVSGCKVGFKIVGKTYYRTTNSNGYASLPINLYKGKYAAQIVFYENELYNSNSINVSVTVKELKVIASNLVKYYKNGSNLNAYIVDDDGNPVSNVKVGFKIGNKCYYRTTDDDGFVSLPINLAVGSYNFEIFASVDNYTSNTLTRNVVVEKMPNQLQVPSTVSKGTYLKVTLLDNNKKGISGIKMCINVLGKNYYRTTDDNGNIYLKINLNPKSYKFVISVLNNNYLVKSVTKTIKVV